MVTQKFAWQLAVGLLFALTSYVCAEDDSDDTIRKQRAAFQAQMNGVELEGFFCELSDDADEPPSLQSERYEIKRVTPLPSRKEWLFQTRIQYGKLDVTVPLPLPVHWAGGTPVITVDQVSIPGLGTFDARVMIDGDRYMGTWRHDEVRGILFGRIRKVDASVPSRTPEAPVDSQSRKAASSAPPGAPGDNRLGAVPPTPRQPAAPT